MKAQRLSLKVAPPLGSGQKIMLAASVGVLTASALTLAWTIPQLPAQITLHYTNLANGTRPGPPSDLWTLWKISLALWAVLGLVAWGLPKSNVPLNGMPPITEENAPRIFQAIRGLFLALQLTLTLLFCGDLLASVVRGFGGPDLMVLALFPIAAIPVSIGYFLYKSSYPPHRN